MTPTETVPTIGFRHFHDQLAHLKQRLLDMSDLATSLLDLSVDALLSRDSTMAEAVLTGDKELDALEIEIEDQAIGLLALQQPMARDLRFIIASIKVSNDLERVGDHAVNIAQGAPDVARRPDGIRSRGRSAWPGSLPRRRRGGRDAQLHLPNSCDAHDGG